jgi:hypothetical protein
MESKFWGAWRVARAPDPARRVALNDGLPERLVPRPALRLSVRVGALESSAWLRSSSPDQVNAVSRHHRYAYAPACWSCTPRHVIKTAAAFPLAGGVGEDIAGVLTFMTVGFATDRSSISTERIGRLMVDHLSANWLLGRKRAI